MNIKVCSVCGEEKPYDSTAKRGRKAAGFVGSKCWSCYVMHSARQDKLREESYKNGTWPYAYAPRGW